MSRLSEHSNQPQDSVMVPSKLIEFRITETDDENAEDRFFGIVPILTPKGWVGVCLERGEGDRFFSEPYETIVDSILDVFGQFLASIDLTSDLVEMSALDQGGEQ